MLDDFFVRALVAGVGVALVASPLGCFIVWRRLAYFGDTLSHAALFEGHVPRTDKEYSKATIFQGNDLTPIRRSVTPLGSARLHPPPPLRPRLRPPTTMATTPTV